MTSMKLVQVPELFDVYSKAVLSSDANERLGALKKMIGVQGIVNCMQVVPADLLWRDVSEEEEYSLALQRERMRAELAVIDYCRGTMKHSDFEACYVSIARLLIIESLPLMLSKAAAHPANNWFSRTLTLAQLARECMMPDKFNISVISVFAKPIARDVLGSMIAEAKPMTEGGFF